MNIPQTASEGADMSEHETESASGSSSGQSSGQSGDDAATSALPGGGDSQYGNDTGFADEALGTEDDAEGESTG